MKKIYHLSNCDTCKRILKELSPLDNLELQDIKTAPLTPSDLDELVSLTGNHEALFSKRARLYKEKGLKDQVLGEEDYRKYLLEHYTFLKRPVIVVDNQIFVGNSKKEIEKAKAAIHP